MRGYLFRSNGVQIASNDEHIEGRGFFKMARRLTRGETYYLMVTGNGTNTGYFSVRVAKEKWPESVTVSPLSATLEIGNTLQLTSTVLPEDANNRDVLYTSDYESVATVHPTSGLVTAVGAGSTTIRVYDWKGRTRGAVCNITVEEIKVTSVTLDCSKRIMKPDDSDFLYATISPSNATNKKLHWYSDNSDVVEVDEDGYIYAVSDGTANITVETDDGLYTDTCTIIVDSREQAHIKNDDHSFYVEFEDGKIWKFIGLDLSKRNDNYYPALEPPDCNRDNYDRLIIEEQRYLDSRDNAFNIKQLAYLYLFDPLGIEFYMKTDALQAIRDEQKRNGTPTDKVMTLSEFLEFEDAVYEAIFGTRDRNRGRFYFRVVDGEAHYVTKDYSRTEVFSNAEILFGFHGVIEWNLAEFIKSFLESLFEFVLGEWIDFSFGEDSIVGDSIEAYQLLFHSGSIVDSYSDAATSYVTDYAKEAAESSTIQYIQNKVIEKYANKISNELLEKKLKNITKTTVHWAFSLLLILADSALGAFNIPNPQDITIYNKVNANSNFLTVYEGMDGELLTKDIIDQVNQN